MHWIIKTAAAMFCASGALAAEFTFVALGDMPYGNPAEVYAPYEALIATINAREPAMVVHVGDTKSGGTACSDDMLNDQLGFLNAFDAPTIYTPGDNEWTDCYRKNAGEFDPLERLGFIRTTYFADPATSFGKAPAELSHQGDAGYPENTRVLKDGVMFTTAHIVGSNNNFEIRDMVAVEEFMGRNRASTRWLRASFAKAQEAGAAAMVVAIHADMFEFGFNSFGRERWLRHSGFATFGPALQREAAAFGKPVLLIYGDSHVFRQLRPFPKTAPNLMSVEVFGAADMHAVEISVNTDAPGIFSVAPLMNPALSK